MKWSVKRANDCNGMKLYCGCISPTERRKRPCEDEEQTAEKIRLPIFWLPYFLCCEVICGMEEGTTDWNSRTEQRERPQRDRLIASPVRAKLSGARDVYNEMVYSKYPIFICSNRTKLSSMVFS
jgi:hypothetical protein